MKKLAVAMIALTMTLVACAPTSPRTLYGKEAWGDPEAGRLTLQVGSPEGGVLSAFEPEFWDPDNPEVVATATFPIADFRGNLGLPEGEWDYFPIGDFDANRLAFLSSCDSAEFHDGKGRVYEIPKTVENGAVTTGLEEWARLGPPTVDPTSTEAKVVAHTNDYFQSHSWPLQTPPFYCWLMVIWPKVPNRLVLTNHWEDSSLKLVIPGQR